MDATTIEQVQKMVRKLNRKSQKDLKNILKIALKDAKTIEEKNHILWIFSKSKISDENFSTKIFNEIKKEFSENYEVKN